MAFYLEIDRCNLIPASLTSSFRCRSYSKTLICARPSSKLFPRVALNGSRDIIRSFPYRRLRIGTDSRILKVLARTKSEHLDEGELKEEVIIGGHNSDKMEDLVPEKKKKQQQQQQQQQQESQLKKRVVFGLAIGGGVAGVVLAGGWIFTVALAATVFVGAREYFELVRSRGITAGMTPPPRYLSRTCSVICAFMPILTLYFGHIDVSVTSAAFVLAIALLLQRGNPRFAQLSSAMFGLFYCGYLPCFWVKLRCGLAAPALNTEVGAAWPILLGGRAHWTVGLVATLISISSIIAADTYAFLGGKTFGRTPLTNISPKKTWEGAIAGLSGCIATTLVLSKILCWPTSLLRCCSINQTHITHCGFRNHICLIRRLRIPLFE